jgi:hypothetical protein
MADNKKIKIWLTIQKNMAHDPKNVADNPKTWLIISKNR